MREFCETGISTSDNNIIQIISIDIMEYMVWIVEIVSRRFFNNNKALAYKTLKECGIWGMYVQNYDVTHSLSANYILQEIQEALTAKGVL